MTPLSVIMRVPALRLSLIAMLVLGALNASIAPYVSLVAIERLGISKQHFSVILVMTAAIAVSSSVLFGVLGDQFGHRRRIAVGSAVAGVIGLGLMMIWPSPLTLVIAHGVMIPLSASLYGQVFTLARLAIPSGHGPQDGVLGVIRSAMSASFLGMLVFWTYAFDQGADVMGIYIPATLCALILLVLIAAYWPAESTWTDAPPSLLLRTAFAEILRPRVALRLVLLGMISAAFMIYFVLISLIFEASPLRGSADVALYVGLVAGWEVPCLILIPRLVGRFSRTGLITFGAGVYTLHVVLMPIWVDTPYLWLGTLIAGVGGTAAISLPISYFQDLLRDRPGAASAMLALQRLVADILGASVFALGTWIGGYETVAVMSALLTLTGAGLLYIADRRRWLMG
jgi:SET family sugar efflux transporter-like MFS transporter